VNSPPASSAAARSPAHGLPRVIRQTTLWFYGALNIPSSHFFGHHQSPSFTQAGSPPPAFFHTFMEDNQHQFQGIIYLSNHSPLLGFWMVHSPSWCTLLNSPFSFSLPTNLPPGYPSFGVNPINICGSLPFHSLFVCPSFPCLTIHHTHQPLNTSHRSGLVHGFFLVFTSLVFIKFFHNHHPNFAHNNKYFLIFKIN